MIDTVYSLLQINHMYGHWKIQRNENKILKKKNELHMNIWKETLVRI